MSGRENLRKAAILAREDLMPEERAWRTERVISELVQLDAFQQARNVMLYRAVGGELMLDSLPEHPASVGKRFAWPLCLEGRNMAAMIPGDWRRGAFGIPEPVRETSMEILPEELDLILCPGVAFDNQGNRLGMGGGYYDRFLLHCSRAVIAMVAFEAQRTENLIPESWDVPMDLIVTETGVRFFERRRRH